MNQSAGGERPTARSLGARHRGRLGPATLVISLAIYLHAVLGCGGTDGESSSSSPDAGPPVAFAVDEPAEAPAPCGRDSVTAIGPAGQQLVVWSDMRAGGGGIYAARVDQGGALLDPLGIRVSMEGGGDTSVPVVAFDGQNYFIVWVVTAAAPGSQSDIFGARLTPMGTLLDPVPIDIAGAATGSNYEANPDLAFDGGNYLIVWEGRARDPSAIGTQPKHGVFAMRVSPAGTALDAAVREISTTTGTEATPVVAYTGSEYVVAWQTVETSNGVNISLRAARVRTDGVALDTPALHIATAGRVARVRPAVGGRDGVAMVTWAEERIGFSPPPEYSIHGSLIRSQEGVGMAFQISQTSYVDAGSIAAISFGQGFAIAFVDGHGATGVKVARVDLQGNVTAPQTVGLAGIMGPNFHKIASDGVQLALGIADGYVQSRVLAVRLEMAESNVSQAGASIEIVSSTQTNVEDEHAAAFDGTNMLAVWTDNREGWRSQIFAALIASGGVSRNPQAIRVLPTSNGQSQPAVAFAGEDYFVVWGEDYIHGGWPSEIVGRRIRRSGQVVDGAISIGGGTQSRVEDIAVIAAGELVWVVWREGGLFDQVDSLRAARVLADGTVLDPGGLEIAQSDDNSSAPALAFADGYLRVFWIAGDSTVQMASVASDTSVVSASQVIATGAGRWTAPRVASDGTTFLLGWLETSGSVWSEAPLSLRAMRLSIIGRSLDPAGLEVFPPSRAGREFSLAFDGVHFVAVREVFPEDETLGEIGAIERAKISTAGDVSAPQLLAASTDSSYRDPVAVSVGYNDVAVLFTTAPVDATASTRVGGLWITNDGCSDTSLTCPWPLDGDQGGGCSIGGAGTGRPPGAGVGLVAFALIAFALRRRAWRPGPTR